MLYRVTSSEAFTAPHHDPGNLHSTHDNPIDPVVGQENVCTSLAAIFPNAHVLLVTPGFRSMIFSSFSQYIRSGADVPLEEFVTHPLIARPWEYDRVIGKYHRSFGEEKVVLMPWELLRDDLDRFGRTLEERLGLGHFPAVPGRVNTSLSSVELYWYPRLTRVVQRLPIGARLRRMYLRGTFMTRFRGAIAMLQRVSPGTPVTADAIPEHLIAAYRAKARALRENPLSLPYAREYYGSDV